MNFIWVFWFEGDIRRPFELAYIMRGLFKGNVTLLPISISLADVTVYILISFAVANFWGEETKLILEI
jgi:hypothetical protein